MTSATFHALSALCTKEGPNETEIELYDARGNVQLIGLSRPAEAQLFRELLATHSGATDGNHPLSTIHALSALLLTDTDKVGIEFLIGPSQFLRVSLPRKSMALLCKSLAQFDRDRPYHPTH